jgi:hypothetical protein
VDRGIRAASATAVVLLLMTLWAASAVAAQVSLGSDAASYTPPRVVVDSIGVGYTSWASGGKGEPLETCRLAPHARRCEAPHAFPFPGDDTSTDAGDAPTFTADGQVAVLDSRCCLLSNQKQLFLSADHGTTFTGPSAIAADAATGMTGNLLDLPPGALGPGTPEQLLTSSSGSVTGGGSIQATGLGSGAADPGWFTPQVSSGSLSQSIGRSGSTLLAVYTSETTPHYSVMWVRYQGGNPNAAASWSAPQPLSPTPSLDSNAQLASGPAGIFVVRSIATPGDNERLVVQRFTGSGWSKPAAVTSESAGERFGISETPTGRIYVIWKATDESLRYAVARNKLATRFGKSVRLKTRGEIEYPQIAVNGEGAGWATWSDDHSPSRVSALPIVPRPKVTRKGGVSLRTPRECVAIGGAFPVSLAGPAHGQLARVRFSIAGGATRAVTRSPYGATLTLRSASKNVVVAVIQLASAHGRTRSQTVRSKLTVCP